MKIDQTKGWWGTSWLLAQMRKVRRAFSLQTFRQRTVTHKFLNSTLDVVIADPVAQKWYAQSLPRAAEMYALLDYSLKPGARVFDIGAHQAVIASMLARFVGVEGSVIALEPDPFSYRIALQNKALNHLEQLQILHAAGADSSGMIEFGLSVGTSGFVAAKKDGLPTISVQAITVDDLAVTYGTPDILYIDVEGYEEHVLKGAKQILTSSKPDCVIEVHIGQGLERAGGSVKGVLSFFPDAIYDIFIKHPDPLRRDELIPLSDVGVENWNYFCNMVAVKKPQAAS